MMPAAALARLAIVGLALALPARGAAPANARDDTALSASAAVRLATLAERIAKLHAQIGQGILVERSRRALPETLRDFDTTLRSIAARGSTPEIRENYVLLGLLWRDYREWALKAPSRESARKVRERCEEVVWIASKGARMIQEQSRASQSPWALRASNAALLSQRIPKLYLWRRWDMRDEALARELRESEENLQRALDALAASGANTPETTAEVEAAKSQFRFMADAAKQFDGGKAAQRQQMEFIAKTGDHILEAMERAARLFEHPRP